MPRTSPLMSAAFISLGLYAQTAPTSLWTKSGTDFSIWLDGYADVNFRHPQSGLNDFRNFNYHSDTARLSLAKLSIDHAPAPFGFHADVGFGQSLTGLHSLDGGPAG